MKLVLHGVLRERYGTSVEIETDTVADAIEGFSRQADDFPQDLVIDAVGFDTLELLQQPTNQAEVHLVPAMFGGGGKFGSIIMGAALIGISFIPGIGPALSASLMAAGIGMAVTGIVGLFMKAPSISKSNDPDASKYLGLNRNTTAIGTPITLAWGRIQVPGHWLSLQSDAQGLVHGTFPTNPT